jgi:hypothetical protein
MLGSDPGSLMCSEFSNLEVVHTCAVTIIYVTSHPRVPNTNHCTGTSSLPPCHSPSLYTAFRSQQAFQFQELLHNNSSEFLTPAR